MITRERLLQIVFSFIGLICLVASVFLSFRYSNFAFLFFVPLSGAGFALSLVLSKYLAVSKKRAEQLSRHVEEVTVHLGKQERLALALQQREELFRGAFESASVGTALVGENGAIRRVNTVFCQMLGLGAAELNAQSVVNYVHKEDRLEVMRSMSRLAETGEGHASLEFRMLPATGDEIWVGWSASLIREQNGETRMFIFHLSNITDRKRAEARLVHDAFHDSLTDLPNRALFLDRVEVAFKRSQRHIDSYFAVVYLDLDRFKLVNDTYGHLFGDDLLRQIAERLANSLRESDTVARLGGDEFAMIIEEAASPDEVEQFISRLMSELAKEYNIDQRSLFATFSVGVAFWHRDYATAEDLLRDADTALYQAKRGGRNCYVIFEPAMQENVSRFLEVETDLRKALGRNEFRVFYQPIVSLADGRLSGFEALIRWEHPVHGLVSPAEFIPIAEETGLIVDIGDWVLEESCRQLAEWRVADSDCTDLWVSVNASCRQFNQPDFVERVISALDRTGLDAANLKIEITESMMVDNLDLIVDKMERLNRLGVRISIDDFGTGYSSLNNLHRLPLSSLKIDRSFVNRIEAGGESDEIIRTIISLAKTLHLEIIAEGIETPLQASHLENLECRFGQGYYFGRPVDAEHARGLLSADRPLVAEQTVQFA